MGEIGQNSCKRGKWAKFGQIEEVGRKGAFGGKLEKRSN